jgi:hypothetical protein
MFKSAQLGVSLLYQHDCTPASLFTLRACSRWLGPGDAALYILALYQLVPAVSYERTAEIMEMHSLCVCMCFCVCVCVCVCISLSSHVPPVGTFVSSGSRGRHRSGKFSAQSTACKVCYLFLSTKTHLSRVISVLRVIRVIRKRAR